MKQDLKTSVNPQGFRLLHAGDSDSNLGKFRPMFGHRFDAAAHMHLLADVFDVGADGFHADVQLIANLLVEIARSQQ